MTKKVQFILALTFSMLCGCSRVESQADVSKSEQQISKISKSEQIIIGEAREIVNHYIDSLPNLQQITGTLIEEDIPYKTGYAYGYAIYFDKMDTTKFYLLLERTVETTTENSIPTWKVLDAKSIKGWTSNQMECSLNTACRDEEFSYFSIVDSYIGAEPKILKTYRLNHKKERLELAEKSTFQCTYTGCGDDEDCD